MAVFAGGYFPNMVYEKKDWELKSFTVDSGVQTAKEKTASALDAVDPNLAPFRSRGGKLILYHGWNDPAIPALSTVNYYEEVMGKLGPERHGFLRSPVHGSRHAALRRRAGCGCVRESGTWPPDPQRNVRTALETWVEKGTAPGEIIASKTASMDPQSAVTMTRPLCPYPQSAQYKGSGDANGRRTLCARREEVEPRFSG